MTIARFAAPVIIPMALALSACGGEGASEGDGEPVAGAASTVIEAPLGERNAETIADTSGTIPARFLGIWDYVGGTCAPESDMRLEISPSEFLYYESLGEVRNVRVDGEYAIVDLAMEGEGETWEQTERLMLTPDGKLHLTDPGDASDTADYPRKKCAA